MATARLMALFILLAVVIAPAHADGRGKVSLLVNPQAPRDQWQRRPLPGAFVVIDWVTRVPAPAHAAMWCRYSELARTDEKGEYVMKGPSLLTIGAVQDAYFVYAPGLQPIAFPYPGSPDLAEDITMAPSTVSPEARLSQISLFVEPGCPDEKLSDPRGLYEAYVRAVLEEAKALKVDTVRGRRDVKHIEAMLPGAVEPDRPQ